MIELPFKSSDFAELWSEYLINKKENHKFEYKNNRSMSMALKKLYRYSNGIEEIAIAILENSISEEWKGFFPLKDNDPLMIKHKNNTVNKKQSASDILMKRYGIENNN